MFISDRSEVFFVSNTYVAAQQLSKIGTVREAATLKHQFGKILNIILFSKMRFRKYETSYILCPKDEKRIYTSLKITIQTVLKFRPDIIFNRIFSYFWLLLKTQNN